MADKYLHSMEEIPLEKIVRDEYRNYQIYTLMDRAIPHLGDGLKPGQRRILYTLWKNRSKGLMKVSSTTGLVLTIHPHGPASVESSIVNLGQDYTFSNNYPLVGKKGYFGERMETSAAAGRYIECRLGKVAEILLFDDINQVEMVPNYDEKVLEPVSFLPKLPIMLLNGAEGIGTGFSSVIPSFNHKDVVASIIHLLENGKTKKLRPFVRGHKNQIEIDGDGKKHIYTMNIEQIGEKIYITDLPKGYDAKKLYSHLTKFIDKDFIKDFFDYSVNNEVMVELVFKRGQTPDLETVQKTIGVSTSLTPNYTLISEGGVQIFSSPEEIIEVFTASRLRVVKRRYELLAKDCEERIGLNSEVIRFIKEKHYQIAIKTKNRKSFVDHLQSSKFKHFDYLADMPIYRMTKEEVAKRKDAIDEDKKAFAEYCKISESGVRVKNKLIEELRDVDKLLTEWMKLDDKEKADAIAASKGKNKSTKSSKKSKIDG